MKRSTLISAALCISLLATGCVRSPKTPAASQVSTSAAASAAAANAVHQATVEVITEMSIKDGDYEHTLVVPKLIVDGKEATEINEKLGKHIRETYPLKREGNNVDGDSTRIVWGVKNNAVSIVLLVSSVCEDYFTREVYNYDLDTLKPLEAKEVTKRLGMTDDEFLSKTTEIIKKYCTGKADYDLDKSLAAVNYDKATPFIMPDGTPGVLGCIVPAADSQFAGLESMRCFNMTTMEHETFR